MKSFSKQLEEATAHIVLSEAEKVRMREQIVAYMEYKPVRTPSSHINTTKKANSFSLFPFFKTHHFSGAFLIAGLVVGSTFGVSFAADEALPGDLLYNVKVNVNEEVRSAFMSTKESQIAWEQERAERRLIEASKLASEGRLNTENKEKVSKLFAEHTEAVVQYVRDIETKDPLFALEASSDLGESLDAHEAVLARLIVENEASQGQDARDLVEQVRTTSMEVEKIREDAQENMPIEPPVAGEEGEEDASEEVVNETPSTEEEKTESANMRIRATQRAHARASTLLEKVEKQLLSLEEGSDLQIQANTQVQHGKDFLQAGEEALGSYEYGTAYNAFRQAENSFEKVRLLLEVQKLFSIEIYPNHEENDEIVEGEEAVVEELNTMHLRVKDEIQDARALLLTRSGHEIAIIEKANSLIKDGEARMLQGEISMVLGDHDSARDFFSRAHTHISRAVALLEKEDDNDAVEELPIPEEEEQPADPEEQPTGNGEEISITHSYSEGVHTYTGIMQVPTPCHSLEQTATVAESFPEQITLIFSSVAPETDMGCITVISEEPFSVSVEASPEAELVNVIMDDNSLAFILNTEPEGDENAPESDSGTTSGFEDRGGLFERAVQTTQELFLP